MLLPPSKTGRTATYVVAASNAPSHVKAQADYVCDGTDDQVEIQAAIDALPAGGGGMGGTIQLSGGRFYISNTILINKTMTLTGMGMVSTVIDLVANTNQTMILSDVSTVLYGITISNLCLNGEKANQSAGYGIYLRGATGSYGAKVDRVAVYNVKQDGIMVEIPLSWITNNHINACGTAGISIATIAASCHVEGNYVQSCGTNGIAIFGVEARVSVNDVWSNSQRGIWLYQTAYTEVINNACTANGYHGISVQGGDSNIIIGNEVYRNSQAGAGSYHGISFGIVSSDTPDNMIVQGNEVFDDQTTKTQGYGVYIASGNNIIVTGNNFRGNKTGAVYIAGGINTNGIVRDNIGYITENSGTATVLNTTTSIVVSHGLTTTPTRVYITLTNNPTNDPQVCWVDTLTATQFTIRTKVDPGATGAIFNWRAVIGEGN